jgi:hypothetical protein
MVGQGVLTNLTKQFAQGGWTLANVDETSIIMGTDQNFTFS